MRRENFWGKISKRRRVTMPRSSLGIDKRIKEIIKAFQCSLLEE